MDSTAANLVTCHRCPLRQRVCRGACPCTVSGRDIIDHATAGDCPNGLHRPADPQPAATPDQQATAQPVKPRRKCGECSRAKRDRSLI